MFGLHGLIMKQLGNREVVYFHGGDAYGSILSLPT